MNAIPYGICKCGLCFEVEYPPEFGKEIVAVCTKCKTIVKESGTFKLEGKKEDYITEVKNEK